MIECRFCHERIDAAPDKAPARCPGCRMPLFERPEKRRPPGYELGPCAFHQETPAFSKCRRCQRLICSVCRTRWHDQVVCPSCLSAAIDAGEPAPRELARQRRLPVWSLVFALVGWTALLGGLIPLRVMFNGPPSKELGTFTGILFMGSLLPALFAVGLGAAALRERQQKFVAATWGVTLAGLHLGVVLGIWTINVWHN